MAFSEIGKIPVFNQQFLIVSAVTSFQAFEQRMIASDIFNV
jgi:hypothetical protein